MLCIKLQKVEAITQLHNKASIEQLTEPNSAVEGFFRSGKLFRGKNQPHVPKMECHHHHVRSRLPEMTDPILHHCLGNRTLISHLPLLHVAPVFLLPLDFRAFEADCFTRLNFSLTEVNCSVSKKSKVTIQDRPRLRTSRYHRGVAMKTAAQGKGRVPGTCPANSVLITFVQLF